MQVLRHKSTVVLNEDGLLTGSTIRSWGPEIMVLTILSPSLFTTSPISSTSCSFCISSFRWNTIIFRTRLSATSSFNSFLMGSTSGTLRTIRSLLGALERRVNEGLYRRIDGGLGERPGRIRCIYGGLGERSGRIWWPREESLSMEPERSGTMIGDGE